MFINIANSTFNFFRQGCRKFSSSIPKIKIREENKANAWQVHSYGDIEELQYGAVRIPKIEDPDELLINVEAASVNPIDLLMMGGYGRTLFQIPRKCKMELPLTLGRDFCGTILYKGKEVGDAFNVGDKVYGFIPVHKQGSFSEVAIANKSHICKKPEKLSPVECTSLVYATMTAWSALYLFGNMLFKGGKGTKVLILGASGGVGTAAVQLLKSQGCLVHVMLFHWWNHWGLIIFLIISNQIISKMWKQRANCAKFGYDNVPKTWKFGTYITLNSPLLHNTDKLGLVGGLLSSASTLLSYNLKPPGNQKCLTWGFFVPSSRGLQFIHNLISQGKIRPLIHKEFKFENLPDAFRELKKGHMRGKIVIKF
ncbi:reticulon-4-interacting protein 1, mitochondrial-like [Asbolus verrucosus]|uniref:Reticulon-4-interacting protein 1, mitochondrial-like n=1 Tax=Asbolus verrucosus TaxID=1661398 RepID=A0A482VTF7_ASBVE|nr:reticulon-4-interacting protein 1, mitochondrial-like [Asbolus verrucosus]